VVSTTAGLARLLGRRAGRRRVGACPHPPQGAPCLVPALYARTRASCLDRRASTRPTDLATREAACCCLHLRISFA